MEGWVAVTFSAGIDFVGAKWGVAGRVLVGVGAEDSVGARSARTVGAGSPGRSAGESDGLHAERTSRIRRKRRISGNYNLSGHRDPKGFYKVIWPNSEFALLGPQAQKLPLETPGVLGYHSRYMTFIV